MKSVVTSSFSVQVAVLCAGLMLPSLASAQVDRPAAMADAPVTAAGAGVEEPQPPPGQPSAAEAAEPQPGPAGQGEAAPVPPQPAPEGQELLAGWQKGFILRSADSRYELKISTRAHVLYAFMAKDMGPDVDREQEAAFSIPLARIAFDGKAHVKGLRYKLEADLSKGFVKLLHAYADYAALPETLHLRAGMWKRPFTRQWIQSPSKYLLVDRSYAMAYFGEGYDIGVAAHNGYEKSPPFEWVAGVFNGDYKDSFAADKPWFEGSGSYDDGAVTINKGAFSNVPKKFHPLLVMRAGLNTGGIDGYSEGDLEGGPLRLALAANLMADFDFDGDDSTRVRAALDFVIKAHGLSLGGALFVGSKQEEATGLVPSFYFDQVYAASGFLVHLGYLVHPRLEPSLRYTLVSPDGLRSAQELAGGLNIYFAKHNFKLQVHGAALINNATLKGTAVSQDKVDYRAMTQLVIQL